MVCSRCNRHRCRSDIGAKSLNISSNIGDEKVETFYTGKGSRPKPEKEGFRVQVYPVLAIYADNL